MWFASDGREFLVKRIPTTQSLVVSSACPLTTWNWTTANCVGVGGRLPEAYLGLLLSAQSSGQMARGAEPCYPCRFSHSPFLFH